MDSQKYLFCIREMELDIDRQLSYKIVTNLDNFWDKVQSNIQSAIDARLPLMNAYKSCYYDAGVLWVTENHKIHFGNLTSVYDIYDTLSLPTTVSSYSYINEIARDLAACNNGLVLSQSVFNISNRYFVTTSSNLNGVCSNVTSSIYGVVVGDNGTLIKVPKISGNYEIVEVNVNSHTVNDNFMSIAWDGTYYVIVTNKGNILVSTDLSTFTMKSVNGAVFEKVRASGVTGSFGAVGGRYTYIITVSNVSSIDVKTSSVSDIPDTLIYKDLVYDTTEGWWVCVGTEGFISVNKLNGSSITTTKITTNTTENLCGACNANGTYVVVGSNKTILKSTDTDGTWTVVSGG